MKQTAVDWFYQRILAKDIKKVFEKAKEMEKEQIKEAFDDAYDIGYFDWNYNSEQYYNETYK